MTDILNSQVSSLGYIVAIAITAVAVFFLLFIEKLKEMKENGRKNSYLKKHRLEDHSTIFYRGEYWVILKYMGSEKSYSIMTIKSKETKRVGAKILIANSISQEKLLGAVAKADSFTEFYHGDEHLLKKYLDDL